jgi:hypothetical protein
VLIFFKCSSGGSSQCGECARPRRIRRCGSELMTGYRRLQSARRALLFGASMQRSCVQNPVCLSFDERIALTGELFELRPV